MFWKRHTLAWAMVLVSDSQIHVDKLFVDIALSRVTQYLCCRLR